MNTIAEYKESYLRRQERKTAERERLRQSALAAVITALQEIGREQAANVARFFVFGSLIHPGQFRPDSDIDLAVEWRRKGDYFGLWRQVEEALGREIDFRELGDDDFSRRVRASGLVAYES